MHGRGAQTGTNLCCSHAYRYMRTYEGGGAHDMGSNVACARVASMGNRYFAREGAEKPIRLGGSLPKILQTIWAIACTGSAAMREAAGST
jgi:hypothetical protein